MDNILQGMINALAYVDDIIVFSENQKIDKIHYAFISTSKQTWNDYKPN